MRTTVTARLYLTIYFGGPAWIEVDLVGEVVPGRLIQARLDEE